jgi:hypothetical protein
MRHHKTSVHHWRFEDGTREDSVGNLWKHDPMPCGWYCWVYPRDDREFEEWMTRMCPSADICHRFNSGDPMWTVYIADEKEATMFTLMWGN